ncbi:MAG: hypothetical protein DCC67_01445 [Planctomycetota bacterium]|nr:MAG: hypothetical protein DCC67_01445 [Planctomycetota bacterium]
MLELSSSQLTLIELRKSVDGQDSDELAASSVAWRKSAVSLDSPEGVEELTAAFREAARTHDLHGCKVRVVLSGDYCVLRTLRGAVDEVQRELLQLEQRSRMYLSLGVGEKVLVSSTWAVDARHAHATAAVCNQATLDAIQAASDAAGIDVAVIEPALCALARAARRLAETPTGAYLLVNVSPSSVEVGVCHEDQLLLDYRPGGRAASTNLLPLLENHLNRLSRHIGRCLRTAPPDIRQVYLCGDEQSVRRAAQQFERQAAIKVHVIKPQDVRATWRFASGEGCVSAAGLGGVLAAYLAEDERGVPNLMQHIIECKRAPLRPALVRSALPLAATLLVAASMAFVNARLQSELDVMQTELDGLAVAEARSTELRLQLLAARAKLTELDKLAGQLPAELGEELILSIAACMPSDVWLRQLEITDRRRARLQGASYLEAGVYDFVRWLELAPRLDEVALRGTSPSTSANGPVTSFDLELTISSEHQPPQPHHRSAAAADASKSPVGAGLAAATPSLPAD